MTVIAVTVISFTLVIKAFISQRSMSNGFIYVVDAHFIDKIEEKKYTGPKCLWFF
jgi:hypothetical protein